MANERDAGKAALVVGSAAAIASAIALLRERRAKAAPGEGELALDDATMDLLIALAESSAALETTASDVLAAIKDMSLQVQGYPPNADGIISGRVLIGAVGRPYGLPDVVVPDDMFIQVKGWPTNAGIIYVAGQRTSATNINQVWPLLANEAVGYRVKNANLLFVSGTVAGDWAVFTVEQRRLGY